MPEQTLRAFADHGEVAVTLGGELDAPEAVLRDAASEGVDLHAITAELEREGVAAFCDSYRQLLSCIESKLGSLSAVA
jgi:transaldolase